MAFRRGLVDLEVAAGRVEGACAAAHVVKNDVGGSSTSFGGLRTGFFLTTGRETRVVSVVFTLDPLLFAGFLDGLHCWKYPVRFVLWWPESRWSVTGIVVLTTCDSVYL